STNGTSFFVSVIELLAFERGTLTVEEVAEFVADLFGPSITGELGRCIRTCLRFVRGVFRARHHPQRRSVRSGAPPGLPRRSDRGRAPRRDRALRVGSVRGSGGAVRVIGRGTRCR